MKIIIEGYPYQEEDVKTILKGFEPNTKNGKTTMNHVGYFYSKEISDCIFFLPKVILDENGEVLFHKGLTPEKILDLDSALAKNYLDRNDFHFLSNFAVWIFRAIKEFYRLNPSSEILLYQTFSLLDLSSNKRDATLVDIILSLVRFNKENQDFFMFTIKNIHSGYNKINWNKTISKSTAVAQRKTPIYLNPINKKKQINFDEELLIIFFSILSHVKTMGFETSINYNYELITGKLFENYLAGYGKIRLRQIKYKYFSDKALLLWQLCYSFFDSIEKINSSQQDSDYLLARNFNIVFESIIDELIGDDKNKIDSSLKDQPDGKIVDHIFRYKSLINENDIYYIGDSKYYKIGGSLAGNSVYKQYTYAKNIIQFNIDWFFKGRPHIRYRDEMTEGYNITPNFFVSAEISKSLSYADNGLKQRENYKDKRQIYQFENRLFDRDTLWLSHFDINFLYVIALYARSNSAEKSAFKSLAQKEFKQKISELLNHEYLFYVLEPRNGYSLQRAVDINFKRLYGKTFRPYDDVDVLILSLKNGAEENEETLKQIEPYFICHDFKLGSSLDELLNTAQSNRVKFKSYIEHENFVDLIAAEEEVEYGSVKKIFTDSEVNRNSIIENNEATKDAINAKSLEDEIVLVGFFKGDEHLASICKNNLYYTRTGFRPGSVRIDVPVEQCKYLFLHNKDSYLMFKLSGAPRFFSGAQLQKKGFAIKDADEIYLGYDLASAEPISFDNIDIRNAIIKGIGNRTADSYFTTLKKLFGL